MIKIQMKQDICSVCKLEEDLYLHWSEQKYVKKVHFKSKLRIDNFNNNIFININKSIEDKFIDIKFDFKKLQNMYIYEDLSLKKIMKEMVNENKKRNKNTRLSY